MVASRSVKTAGPETRFPAPGRAADKAHARTLDNLGSHKVPGGREAIEAGGAHVLYLPAYSPDLNPIEMVFARIKPIPRKMAIRTVEALWEAPGSITECVSATECQNFFRHVGYFQSG